MIKLFKIEKKFSWLQYGASYFLLAILFTACSTTSSSEESHYKVKIDSNIWLAGSSLSWPNGQKHVNVMMGAVPDTKICDRALINSVAEELAKEVDAAGLSFGLACDELWVLFPLRDQLLLGLSDHEKKAVATHEAFHLAAQLYNERKVRIEDAMDFDHVKKLSPTKMRQTDIFFNRIASASQVGNARSKNYCETLTSSYRSYDKDQIDYMRNRIEIEWPAEFYMREAFFRNKSDAYYEFRNRAYNNSPGNILYSSGTEAIKRIEKSITRLEWQKRYLAGETLLNIYFESMGCTKPDPPALLGTSKGIGNSRVIVQQ